MKSPYWIVHATGIVQGVYGGALRAEAEACAKRIEEQTGALATVAHLMAKNRPYVGQRLGAPVTPD